MGRLRKAPVNIINYILNNSIVLAIIVSIVGVVYLVLRAIDRTFRTHFKKALIDRIHDVSRDNLSTIRRAQIKYLFKRAYGLKKIRIKLAGGSYWMSIPCIVEGDCGDKKTKRPKKYLGKIINDRSAIKHHYMTILRKLGVLTEGTRLDFMDHIDAQDMVDFERDWMRLLKRKGINVPEVYDVHRLNHDDYILVMEFIEGRPLSEVVIDEAIADQIFATLKVMHETGVFHGDVKLDNFLYADGRIYVVDSLKINPDEPQRAHEFDLACAVLALAQRLPVKVVMEYALKYHPEEELTGAAELLGVALHKIDLEVPPEIMDEIRRSFEMLKVAGEA